MEEGEIIDGAWRAFVASRRTATLATTTEDGQARLVPICFIVDEPGRPAAPVTLWTPLDDKPKQDPNVRRLARVRDIGDRPGVTLLFERWSEDWSRLAWLRARGLASLVEPRAEAVAHATAVEALRTKYPQYRSHAIDSRPLIRIVITEATHWCAAPDPTFGPHATERSPRLAPVRFGRSRQDGDTSTAPLDYHGVRWTPDDERSWPPACALALTTA